MSAQKQQAPIMNYKNACMETSEPTNLPIQKPQTTKCEKPSTEKQFQKSCQKAVRILTNRWNQYKKDYIELYGEDIYNKMYICPNYWVMPEDEEDPPEEEEDNYDSYEDY